jgi:hypothetical protein
MHTLPMLAWRPAPKASALRTIPGPSDVLLLSVHIQCIPFASNETAASPDSTGACRYQLSYNDALLTANKGAGNAQKNRK